LFYGNKPDEQIYVQLND